MLYPTHWFGFQCASPSISVPTEPVVAGSSCVHVPLAKTCAGRGGFASTYVPSGSVAFLSQKLLPSATSQSPPAPPPNVLKKLSDPRLTILPAPLMALSCASLFPPRVP